MCISYLGILLNFLDAITETIIWPCAGILILSWLLLILIVVLTMQKVPIFTTFEEVGEKEIKKILENYNKTYMAKGFEWKPGPRFIYLELIATS